MSAKIERSERNLVDIPSGTVVRKDGRVYISIDEKRKKVRKTSQYEAGCAIIKTWTVSIIRTGQKKGGFSHEKEGNAEGTQGTPGQLQAGL